MSHTPFLLLVVVLLSSACPTRADDDDLGRDDDDASSDDDDASGDDDDSSGDDDDATDDGPVIVDPAPEHERWDEGEGLVLAVADGTAPAWAMDVFAAVEAEVGSEVLEQFAALDWSPANGEALLEDPVVLLVAEATYDALIAEGFVDLGEERFFQDAVGFVVAVAGIAWGVGVISAAIAAAPAAAAGGLAIAGALAFMNDASAAQNLSVAPRYRLSAPNGGCFKGQPPSETAGYEPGPQLIFADNCSGPWTQWIFVQTTSGIQIRSTEPHNACIVGYTESAPADPDWEENQKVPPPVVDGGNYYGIVGGGVGRCALSYSGASHALTKVQSGGLFELHVGDSPELCFWLTNTDIGSGMLGTAPCGTATGSGVKEFRAVLASSTMARQ